MATKTAKTLLTVKTDVSLKKAAQKTAKKIGLPLGTVVNGFLRRFVATKEAYFAESYKPNVRLRKAIEDGEREYAEGKLKPVTIEDMKRELLSRK